MFHWCHHKRWHCLFDQKLYFILNGFFFTLSVLENWIYNCNSAYDIHVKCLSYHNCSWFIIICYCLHLSFKVKEYGWNAEDLYWCEHTEHYSIIHLMKMSLDLLSFPYLNNIVVIRFRIKPAHTHTQNWTILDRKQNIILHCFARLFTWAKKVNSIASN